LPVQARYQPLIQSLVARGWLLQEGTRIRLSDEGLLWHSEVAAEFLAEATRSGGGCIPRAAVPPRSTHPVA
jgi:coproporphyrinogen III oxidase-like Fe-S oxidoreductase